MFVVVFTMFFQGGLIPRYLLVRSLGLTNTRWALILPQAVAVWNLIIMRTFSKSWGLAGLRVGYAVANKELITFLKNVQKPYSLNIIGQTIIPVIINSISYIDEAIQKMKVIARTQSEAIIIRDRSDQPLLQNCVRITIGTHEMNEYVITTLKKILGAKSNERK